MGLDNLIDRVKDKVEDVVDEVIENVNEVREDIADKVEETGEKISELLSENAKDKYNAYKEEYAQWESQMQNQSTADIKKSAEEKGYILQYDTNGNIDWESTRAENYPSDNLKNERDNAEKNAFHIENMSKNFAEWLRGGSQQTESLELVEIKDGIVDTVSKLDHIINDFDNKILSDINQFYIDLESNIGKWEGETQEKVIAIAKLFKLYLDNIKYFYEALKTHIQMLEQDTECFYGNSSQVKNLNSLIR